MGTRTSRNSAPECGPNGRLEADTRRAQWLLGSVPENGADKKRSQSNEAVAMGLAQRTGPRPAF